MGRPLIFVTAGKLANENLGGMLMKALVFHGPKKIEWEEKDKPTIQNPTDAIVKITKTTICGTDLHILGGENWNS